MQDSDINTTSMLAAFDKHETLSWVDFSNKGIYLNVHNGTARAHEISGCIDGLENERCITRLPQVVPLAWRITSHGKDVYTGILKAKKASQERDQQQEAKFRLELESLQLQIDSLKQQPLDNKRTRQLSWIAIGIAAVPVLIELLKMLLKS